MYRAADDGGGFIFTITKYRRARIIFCPGVVNNQLLYFKIVNIHIFLGNIFQAFKCSFKGVFAFNHSYCHQKRSKTKSAIAHIIKYNDACPNY